MHRAGLLVQHLRYENRLAMSIRLTAGWKLETLAEPSRCGG